MQASSEHVQYQLPNEHSRVGFLLEAIQCSDPGLQAAMASIKTDNGLEGMRNNFEATAAHLFPYDPVAKKRSSGQKRGSPQISSAMNPSPTKTSTPWSKKAELYIGLIKEAVRKDIQESNSPLCFWDYCVDRRARINNLTAKNAFRLHGSTPHTLTTGDEGNISNLCQYGWYEWFYFRDQTAAFPNSKEVLGRVLGPARGAGNEMA